MVDTIIKALQLIGSLVAVGLAWSAVVSYLIIWPVDRFEECFPLSLDSAVSW